MESPSMSVGARVVWSGREGLYGRPPSLSATFTHLIINPTGYAGDHQGLCWRMRYLLRLPIEFLKPLAVPAPVVASTA
jgi:hypothetical protein